MFKDRAVLCIGSEFRKDLNIRYIKIELIILDTRFVPRYVYRSLKMSVCKPHQSTYKYHTSSNNSYLRTFLPFENSLVKGFSTLLTVCISISSCCSVWLRRALSRRSPKGKFLLALLLFELEVCWRSRAFSICHFFMITFKSTIGTYFSVVYCSFPTNWDWMLKLVLTFYPKVPAKSFFMTNHHSIAESRWTLLYCSFFIRNLTSWCLKFSHWPALTSVRIRIGRNSL